MRTVRTRPLSVDVEQAATFEALIVDEQFMAGDGEQRIGQFFEVPNHFARSEVVSRMAVCVFANERVVGTGEQLIEREADVNGISPTNCPGIRCSNRIESPNLWWVERVRYPTLRISSQGNRGQ